MRAACASDVTFDHDETYGFFRVSAFLTAHTDEMRLRFDSFRSGVQMTKRVSSALVSFVKKQNQNQSINESFSLQM